MPTFGFWHIVVKLVVDTSWPNECHLLLPIGANSMIGNSNGCEMWTLEHYVNRFSTLAIHERNILLEIPRKTLY